MARYFVNQNAQPNGDHEVHTYGCSWSALVVSKRDLGEHASCWTAVATARAYYPTANGCYWCASACHTS